MGGEDDLCFSPLTEVADLIRNRDVSPVQLTAIVLSRIERVESRFDCYLSVLSDQARTRATAMEELLQAGTYLGPLHGIPISLKDNIMTSGVQTTAGSAILSGWIPTADATLVKRLDAVGAVLIAKANLYEYAYGAPHRRTRNPWNLELTCSGSSNGSASAVAGGLCYGSIGTDTGGSIRVPAALCGIVGVKPTYGLVSRAGVIPVSYSLDSAGPMARTVRDAAVLLQAIAGRDPSDPTTADRPLPDYTARIEDGVTGLRVGVALPQESEQIHPEVQRAIGQVPQLFEREGAVLVEVHLPEYEQTRTVMWTISSVEAAEYHRSNLRTRPGDYHPTVRTLLELGEFIPATEYVHAQRVRQRMIQDLQSVFAQVDVLLLPAFPVPAYPIEAKTVQLGGRELELRELHNYTPLFNLTGRPAIVLPCGFSSEGLPIGLQIVGRIFDEATMFRVARAYERVTDWHLRRPPI